MRATTAGVKRRSKRRITPLEILTTATVTGVLVAAFVPPATEYFFGKGTAAALEPDVQQLRVAVDRFTADVQHYPGDLQQLVTPIVSTSGNGDTLDFDGAATPVQFTDIEASHWRGPYTPAVITSGPTGGGQFTSKGLLFTVGRRITLSAGWLTVPILSPTTCAAIVALDRAIDSSGGRSIGASDGAVIWEGTCSRTAINGRVSNPLLRIAQED
jgi:hypothetical protein